MHYDDLHPASFRGVPFDSPKNTTREGRNSVVHDYPDQAMRYAEDNGAIPPFFDMPAVLHGKNLPAKVNRLRAALMRPGPGVLVHPIFGKVFVMVDQTYTINYTQSNSGLLEFNIPFITTGAPVLPGLVTGVAAVVSQLSASAIQKAFDSFIKSYGSPLSPFSSEIIANNIIDVVSGVVASFGRASGPAKQLVAKAGMIAQDMELAGSLWADAYRAPIDEEEIPAATLVKGFNSVREKAQTIVKQAEKIKPTTLDLAARKTTVQMIGEYNEYVSFVSMAEGMAGREYITGDEVDIDELLLWSSFSELQERGLPAEQHSEMFDIYTATSDILDRSSVRLPRLTQLDVSETPASVLAYSLYETDGMNRYDLPAKAASIVNLNPNQNPSVLGSETTVLDRTLNER